MWRIRVDDGYHGVTQGTRTSSLSVSLSMQASCLFVLCFHHSKCSALDCHVSSPVSQKHKMKLQECISVSWVEHVSRQREKKKKGSLKDFFKKWGIVWWGRNTFLLREERIFPFVGFLRRWETQRWVHIIALSDKETYHTCVSEAVADYGGEVIKCV